MLKPLGKRSTIITVSLNTILIDLNKVQEPLACVGHVLLCGAIGCGWLAENVKFYFSQPFPFLCIFPLHDPSLRHRKITIMKRFVFKSFFNCLVDFLVKPLGVRSSSKFNDHWFETGGRKAK